MDAGAANEQGGVFHSASLEELMNFISPATYLCGHNIIDHDKKHIEAWLGDEALKKFKFIDTLYLSPLLFPERPYHRLIKDDKLDPENLNNPYVDATKARDLFYDELTSFKSIDHRLQQIYLKLLDHSEYFRSFFEYSDIHKREGNAEQGIRDRFQNRFCSNASLSDCIQEDPVALAYALALINCDDRHSITPPWVLHRFPNVERYLFRLRSQPCLPGCAYCNQAFDASSGLKEFFGFPSFREFDGKPLQEMAVKAALQNKSILAIFPTGGGKSLTYQVPALMAGKHSHALTVIISPLQSLMKDQVDNLLKKDITDAVTINGLLDPVERSKSVESVKEGLASILYISPESLRSKIIERLLLDRKIARFVIDEAHCFSAWGQDFRVDYLYIGKFLKSLQEMKNLQDPIPVSCFTATAKPQVIEDIQAYFKDTLQINLELFHSASTRKNLQYQVIHCADPKEKYYRLRDLIQSNPRPTIVYVSRVKRTSEIASRLIEDGFSALPYHGKMEPKQKTTNQNSFMSGENDIIVATSAFGMGVDKDNVGMVVHYDISDSLENYVQEAGRAGRDEKIRADCYVLFNEDDLGKHFILLNQTKINIHEIQDIWKAVKKLSRIKDSFSNSALEIARKAGWNEQVEQLETRVTTAIAALEEAGYLSRIHNSPRIFATSILAKNADEALQKINASTRMNEKQKIQSTRIIKMLISSRSRKRGSEEEAESRTDYISDLLGINLFEVHHAIQLLREEGLLADNSDLTVSFSPGTTRSGTVTLLEEYALLEKFIYDTLEQQDQVVHLKKINEEALSAGKVSDTNRIRTVLNFWAIKNWIRKEKREGSQDHFRIKYAGDREGLSDRITGRHELASFIIHYLFERMIKEGGNQEKDKQSYVEFSIHEVSEAFRKKESLFRKEVSIYEVEEALFYLTRIEALSIEGGFLVIYNKLNIHRKEKNTYKQYKKEDYENLKLHYDHKTQQIHIVGEYAKKLLQNYESALTFVDDYFSLNYSSFLQKYFPGSRRDEIKKTITPEQYRKLFDELTDKQLEIIDNSEDQYLVVAAGPGSGKTKLLVHKLASIVRMEDVKYEHLLMLTFSRAAVNEFKQRLIGLIGGAAHYIEIKTFHSFCFDLLGRVGNVERSAGIIEEAVKAIRSGVVDPSRITKSVLVIDEAQDMDFHDFELVKVLMEENPEMRIIAVGDDDQNIYAFRGSDQKYFRGLAGRREASQYELTENFRSRPNLVAFTNRFARTITERMKTTDIVSRHAEEGTIHLYRHSSEHLEVPVVYRVMNAELVGTTSVLTWSNKDAVIVAGLLKRKGAKVRLIQTNEYFSLLKLRESRYLFELVGREEVGQTLTAAQLEMVQRKLMDRFGKTRSANLIHNALGKFIELHPKVKYLSDLEIFIGESRMEDFIDTERDTIMVSTMHKTKGREFDNVYIMLDHFIPDDDKKRRLLYVAMTRAKSKLEIHFNDDTFRSIPPELARQGKIETHYDPPDEITVQLTHEDVQLGYFGYVQKRVLPLNSEEPLKVDQDGCMNGKGERVLKFSAKFKEELSSLEKDGYHPYSSSVHLMVYWFSEDNKEEYLIVLPEIILKRRNEVSET